jgi:hypothetical protein
MADTWHVPNIFGIDLNVTFILFLHLVIRTPVQHCELNPIELIWVQVKGFVAKNNTTFRLKDVKELTYMYAAFGKITKDVWTKAEEHVAEKGMLCCVR